MNSRQILRNLLLFVILLPLAAPAQAQDMGDNGFILPDFFFSRAEQLARATCVNKLPNCRPNVRNQLELERAISLIAPWFLTAAAMAVVFAYFRRKEAEKQKHRRMAQRKHVSGAHRRQEAAADKDERRERVEDDRFN
jgi:hypothetical protein